MPGLFLLQGRTPMSSLAKTLISLLIITLVVTAVASAAITRNETRPPKIIIADARAIDHLNLYVAKETGLFRKHGLDVAIVEVRDQAAAREMVVSGQADLFWSCPSVAVSAIAGGAPLKIVAQVKSPCSSHLFLARRSPVAAASDLKGKRIAGVSPQCEGVLAYQKIAREAGGEFIVEIAGGARALANLAAGSIDGAILEEPFASIAEMKGFKAANIRPAAMPCRTINVRTGFLRENPEALKRLMTAVREANAVIRKDPTSGTLLDICARYTATRREVAQRAVRHFNYTERIDEKGLLALADELLRAKAIRENPRERLFARELQGITWGRP
jgi:NitT/TauT family transport system substrate-binding protein